MATKDSSWSLVAVQARSGRLPPFISFQCTRGLGDAPAAVHCSQICSN